MGADPEPNAGISRRRFVSALALAAAGTVAATTTAGAIEAAGNALNPGDAETDPEAVPWDVRRRRMLRAHEETVLVGREEG